MFPGTSTLNQLERIVQMTGTCQAIHASYSEAVLHTCIIPGSCPLPEHLSQLAYE